MPRPRRVRFLLLAVLAATVSLLLVDDARAVPQEGGITQLAGAAGCVAASGGGCTAGWPLDGAQAVALSHDGSTVYIVSEVADAVSAFSRDAETGTLSEVGCTSETGTAGSCFDGIAMNGAYGVAVSPDGKHVYVASSVSDAVAAFSRDPSTGAITQLAGTDACVSETGTSGSCVDGIALNGARSVAVSPDGQTVYVASDVSDAVAIFARNSSTGVLTQLAGTDACVSETGTGGNCQNGVALNGARSIAVSADGKNVYVASIQSDAVAALSRDTSTGALTQLAGSDACVNENGSSGCVNGGALNGARSVAVSPDGKSVYVASEASDAVAFLSRDSSSGALTQIGCASLTGAEGCENGESLNGAAGVAVSPDGLSVYVTADVSDGVAVFSRTPSTGDLSQLSGTDGCVSETGTGGLCADGDRLDGATASATSPDGKYVYVVSDVSDAGAVFSRQLAPTCDDVSAQSTAGASVTIGLSCSDANGDLLTWLVGAQPPNRSVSAPDQAAGTVTYTPNAGFSGTDTFTYAASDGAQQSALKTVSVAVAAVGGETPAGEPEETPKASPPAAGPRLRIGPNTIRVGRNRVVPIRLRCPASEAICAGRVVLRSAKKLQVSAGLQLRRTSATVASAKAKRIILGRRTFVLLGGKKETVKLRLSKRNFRLLVQRRALAVRVAVLAWDESGTRRKSTRRVILKPDRVKPSS